MIKEALLQLLKNVSIKIELKGAAGAAAVGFACGAAAYGIHEYCDLKKTEFKYKQILSLLESGNQNQDNDDRDERNPLPVVA